MKNVSNLTLTEMIALAKTADVIKPLEREIQSYSLGCYFGKNTQEIASNPYIVLVPGTGIFDEYIGIFLCKGPFTFEHYTPKYDEDYTKRGEWQELQNLHKELSGRSSLSLNKFGIKGSEIDQVHTDARALLTR